MAYDETIAEAIRQLLGQRKDVAEKRLVGGGLGFMVGGNLCCGISSRGLTVRVGAEGKQAAVAMEHVGPLAFGGKETAAFVVVAPEALEDPDILAAWVGRGLKFVETL
ncbi:MAG: RNA methyltransferase [Acidimicrobiia bacterium]|nr:RNA methyltransferase [Acidimicrobiia bacterium]